jgi:predicted nucleic acid-binding protein
MTDWVVDSNVMAKWVLAEADSDQANRVIEETTANLAKVFALDLAFVEAAHVIWTHSRRGLISRAEAEKSFPLLKQFPVDVESSSRLLDAGFDIALVYGIAVYDALFVALVRDLKIGGVTADVPLVRAVGKDFPEIVLLKNW